VTHPVLYSFRRCPYAMRARLAIASSGQTVELREILLRDKPIQMLDASPKGTVPVLIADTVIEESIDVMHWALGQSDPEGLNDLMSDDAHALIVQCDGGNPWLFGARASLADFAILPFVRQFAHTDLDWWDAQPFHHAQKWLSAFKASDRFTGIMTKYTPWKDGDDVILFP